MSAGEDKRARMISEQMFKCFMLIHYRMLHNWRINRRREDKA